MNGGEIGGRVWFGMGLAGRDISDSFTNHDRSLVWGLGRACGVTPTPCLGSWWGLWGRCVNFLQLLFTLLGVASGPVAKFRHVLCVYYLAVPTLGHRQSAERDRLDFPTARVTIWFGRLPLGGTAVRRATVSPVVHVALRPKSTTCL
jgi:hypothetical protein